MGLGLVLAGCATESPVSPRPDREAGAGSIVAPKADPTARERLVALLANPEGDPDGRLRAALCIDVAIEEGPAAAPLLIEILEKQPTEQPITVFRLAVTALGITRAPEAAGPLVRALFRIQDQPGTVDIGRRATSALAGMGEPAVEAVLAVLDRRDAALSEIMEARGISWAVVELWMASFLGEIGSPTAVPALIKRIEGPSCGQRVQKQPREDGLVGGVARALGLIGDERAVPALCACVAHPMVPDVDFEILEAMSRIGGPSATACLLEVVRSGEYSPEHADTEYRYQPRWEAVRLAALSGVASDVPAIRRAIAENRAEQVRRESEAWSPGLDLLERCRDSRACYEDALADGANPWFVREVAAYRLSRLAEGDLTASLAISRAFSVDDPDARVSMALLAPRVARGQKCPACIAEIEAVFAREAGKTPQVMMLAVLLARTAIARFGGTASGLLGKPPLHP